MTDVRPKSTSFCIGEDLYGVSRHELEERIGLLQQEIARIQAELTKKQSELGAAELIFGRTP